MKNIKMKNIRMKIVGFTGLITLICLFGFNVFQNSIIGSWISETDAKSKLVFSSDGKCKEYYDNVLQDEYSYVISNTSPQCGSSVHVDQHTSYLKLINVNDSQDIYCYEINGITSKTISIRLLEKGGFILYNKV